MFFFEGRAFFLFVARIGFVFLFFIVVCDFLVFIS